MTVNGLRLPTAFEEMVRQGKSELHWKLKGEVDAYGNHLWVDTLELFGDVETIVEETAQLAQDFLPENNADELFDDSPGFIPWILDFSRIVWFGHMSERDPVCFDFRDDPQEPSIIFWADAYWRRLAPSFEDLMDMYEPFDLTRWIDRA